MNKYIKSPLNYVGGKHKILDQIFQYFPTNINTFYDIFGGGFNVGINVNARKIIYNDIIFHIPNLLKKIYNDSIDNSISYIHNTIKKYELSKVNSIGYIKFREEYNQKNDKNPLDLFILICYGYNHQIRFNNNLKFNNTFGKDRSSFSASLENRFKMFTLEMKKKNISFFAENFLYFKNVYYKKDDFLYFDPPYLISTASYNDGKRGFCGWTINEEMKLLDFLDDLNGKGVKFALNNVIEHKGKINDALLKWSKKYRVIYLKNNFSNSSHNTDKHSTSKEVLIINY